MPKGFRGSTRICESRDAMSPLWRLCALFCRSLDCEKHYTDSTRWRDLRDLRLSWSCRVTNEGQYFDRNCVVVFVLRARHYLFHLEADFTREGLRTVRRQDDCDWLTTWPAVVAHISLISFMSIYAMTPNTALEPTATAPCVSTLI